jgi:hypothetical protein
MAPHNPMVFPPGHAEDTGGQFVTRTEFYNFVNQLATSINLQLTSITENTGKTSEYLREQNGKLATAVSDIAVLKSKVEDIPDIKKSVDSINEGGCRAGRSLHVQTPSQAEQSIQSQSQSWTTRKTVATSGISGAALMALVYKVLEWLSQNAQHVSPK